MTSDALPNVDAQNTGNIELLEYPSYDNFLQSSSAFAVRNLNRIPSRERLCLRLWVRVENSFVDWWMGELLTILLSLIALCHHFYTVQVRWAYAAKVASQCPSPCFVVSTLAAVSKSLLLLAIASPFGQLKWLWMSSKQRRLQDLQVFDEASRDPRGAAKLLASRRGL